MPALLSRHAKASHERSSTLTALIASVEAGVGPPATITIGDFRQAAREQRRSADAIWAPIRTHAARHH